MVYLYVCVFACFNWTNSSFLFLYFSIDGIGRSGARAKYIATMWHWTGYAWWSSLYGIVVSWKCWQATLQVGFSSKEIFFSLNCFNIIYIQFYPWRKYKINGESIRKKLNRWTAHTNRNAVRSKISKSLIH